jgi:hypothetical protein
MGRYKKNSSRHSGTNDTADAQPTSPYNTKRPNATTLEQSKISNLQRRIQEECPERGYAPPLNQKVSFRSLPISEGTLRGLEEGDGKNDKNNGSSNNNNGGGAGKSKKKTSNFSNKKQFWVMTDIQNACIPHALKGRDILGAARTGR